MDKIHTANEQGINPLVFTVDDYLIIRIRVSTLELVKMNINYKMK